MIIFDLVIIKIMLGRFGQNYDCQILCPRKWVFFATDRGDHAAIIRISPESCHLCQGCYRRFRKQRCFHRMPQCRHLNIWWTRRKPRRYMWTTPLPSTPSPTTPIPTTHMMASMSMTPMPTTLQMSRSTPRRRWDTSRRKIVAMRSGLEWSEGTVSCLVSI